MIKIMNISCPHCLKSSQLYLSVDPKVVVLSCPECGVPIVIEENSYNNSHLENKYSIQNPNFDNLMEIFEKNNLLSETQHGYDVKDNKQITTFAKNAVSLEYINELKIILTKECDVKDFIKII